MTENAKSPATRASIAPAITAIAAAVTIFVFPDEAYLWVKAVHVIAVISWMAGMLYLPRLFIYHCAAEKGSVQSETFKIMEQRLLRVIINPAMVITWILGLWMAWSADYLLQPWFLAKFACVFALSGVHGYFSAAVRKFADDNNDKSERHWRIMNEAPTVLMIAIVILVIVKPF